MDLSNLKPAEGAIKKGKRIARGQGSGHGGTATRGHKGAKSRSGYSSKIGFEGGQMPLQRRIPKRGFKNPGRVEYKVLNLNQIQELADKYQLSVIDFDTLRKHRIIAVKDKIKVLGNGELTTKMEIKVHAVSETAKSAIESAGGSVTLI